MQPTNTARKTPAEDASGAAAGQPVAEALSETIDVDSRFGLIRVAPDQTLTMPRGMPGFPGFHQFGIAHLPDARFARFLALQCLDKPSLSFLLLPEASAPGIIAPKHREASAQDLEIAPPDVAIAFIVAIRKLGGKPEISANLRAPVIVDTRRRLAWQYIMPFGDYSVRHILNPSEETAQP